jgi:calcineurin-like phosphoesterase family protein
MTSDDLIHRLTEFDSRHEAALRRIWLLGDVHSQFEHLTRTLGRATELPTWLVFLGDIETNRKPFREILAPLHRHYPNMKVAFIHGNHDADSYEHWEMLHDASEALPLHGRVVDMEGVKVAGLGGLFQGRVWMPPAEPVLTSKAAALEGVFNWRGGERPAPKYLATIYWDEFETLAAMQADLLVTHEAPSCHPYENAAIDELAQRLKVTRSFHGHHHDDLSDEYAGVRTDLGFDARAVDYRGIKNGLGEVIVRGDTK